MGEIVRKTAAKGDILADVRTTGKGALLRGAMWAAEYTRILAKAATAADKAEAGVTVATENEKTTGIALDLVARTTRLTVSRVYDDLRDALGRPKSDPDLEVAFPGGSTSVIETAIAALPNRIDVAAELIGDLAERMDETVLLRLVSELVASAAMLRTAVKADAEAKDALALASAKLDGRARAAQIHLSRLKKAYRACGFSEVEIHRVIPDRSTRRPKAAAPTPAPASVDVSVDVSSADGVAEGVAENTAPGEAAPSEAAPSEAAPAEATPSEAAPGETTPSEAL